MMKKMNNKIEDLQKELEALRREFERRSSQISDKLDKLYRAVIQKSDNKTDNNSKS